MGRYRQQLNSVAFFVGAALVLSIFAADTALGQGPPFPPGHKNHRGRGVRDRWMQLPPEERQVFERNAERWLRMTPQQQQVLRERERLRRARMKTEAESLMRQSGLHLDPTARDMFEARYFQERLRMERALRREIEAKRQQQLPALSERLRSEFQPTRPGPSARSTSSPAGSTGPRH